MKIGDKIKSRPTGNIGIIVRINGNNIFYKVVKVGLTNPFIKSKINSLRSCFASDAVLIKSGKHPLTNIFN